jgi:hypothetical protein
MTETQALGPDITDRHYLDRLMVFSSSRGTEHR